MPARATSLHVASLRMPKDVPARLDRLVSYLKSTDIGRVKPLITRADVLRHALDLGIEVLERRAAMAAQVQWEESLLAEHEAPRS